MSTIHLNMLLVILPGDGYYAHGPRSKGLTPRRPLDDLLAHRCSTVRSGFDPLAKLSSQVTPILLSLAVFGRQLQVKASRRPMLS
jgi:hypothetical protein